MPAKKPTDKSKEDKEKDDSAEKEQDVKKTAKKSATKAKSTKAKTSTAKKSGTKKASNAKKSPSSADSGQAAKKKAGKSESNKDNGATGKSEVKPEKAESEEKEEDILNKVESIPVTNLSPQAEESKLAEASADSEEGIKAGQNDRNSVLDSLDQEAENSAPAEEADSSGAAGFSGKPLPEEDSEEIDEDELEHNKMHTHRSLRLYRKIALSFIVLTVLMVAVIFYFSIIKVTIVLIPDQEKTSNNMIFDVYNQDSEETEAMSGVPGIVRRVEVEHQGTYPASGSEVIGQEVVGQAVIINNYNQNQPLVATTRLLTPDGVLYRITETVNVPAGGEVEVDIYADEPDQDNVIEPSRFTIPGLWAGLQDQIYAESEEATVYREKVNKRVAEEDIENARRDMKQQLLEQAKEDIGPELAQYDQVIYKADENSITVEVNAEPGEETEEFTADMTGEVTIVAFSGKKAADLAKRKFVSTLPSGKELISFQDEDIVYSLNSYDHLGGTAAVNANFEGKISLNEESEIVEIDKILGLSQEQLDAYLEDLDEIAGYEIRFSPAFLPDFLKRVPKLTDKILIEVKR